MATTPSFTSTPRLEFARVTAANTGRDGSGTVTSIITAAAAGTKVFEVVVEAEVTTTAGMVRLFLTIDGATTWRLFDEIPVVSNTVSASAPAARTRRVYDNLVLRDASCRLGCTTHNAEAHVVWALGGDLT